MVGEGWVIFATLVRAHLGEPGRTVRGFRKHGSEISGEAIKHAIAALRSSIATATASMRLAVATCAAGAPAHVANPLQIARGNAQCVER
jgi:hypothetical protein